MELRDRIISESFQLFMKFGIRSVTMDQISGHLGISKRTLYENFKEKNELLKEGLEQFAGIRRKEAREIIDSSENVIETIYILARKSEMIRQQFNPMFFEDIRKYFPEIHQAIAKDGKYKNSSFILELLKKGQKEGLFREFLDIELVNIFIDQIMSIVIDDEVFPKERYSHEDIFSNIMMPYLAGISTTKGREQIQKYFENENG